MNLFKLTTPLIEYKPTAVPKKIESVTIPKLRLAPAPKTDTVKFSAMELLQKRACEAIAKKLDTQFVKKADVVKFLGHFEGGDKEYAQELLFQSVDNFSIQNILEKHPHTSSPVIDNGLEIGFMQYIFKKGGYEYNSSPQEELNAINSFLNNPDNEVKWSPSYSAELRMKTTALTQGLGPYARMIVMGRIHSKPLTNEEAKILSNVKNLEVDRNGFDNTLNFMDFAIDPTGEYAKKKASAIIKRAKVLKIKAEKHHQKISTKTAIKMALSERRAKNTEAINAARDAKGLAPVHVAKTSVTRVASTQELLALLAEDEKKKTSLKQNLKKDYLEQPEFLHLLKSDNGFVFYSPRKTFDALRDISTQIQAQLKKDNIAPEDVVFIRPKRRDYMKSTSLVSYMFQKLGGFDEKQFLNEYQAAELAQKSDFGNKALVFLDDINGSGCTADNALVTMKKRCKEAKAIYIAHIVSFEKARNHVTKHTGACQLFPAQKITHIYHQNGVGLNDERHPIYSEIKKSNFLINENWCSFTDTNATQSFFFSTPDNMVSELRHPLETRLK